jgi:hypothetical protein
MLSKKPNPRYCHRMSDPIATARPIFTGERRVMSALRGQKVWKPSLFIWNYCKPLKSHKTTKTFFGNPWRKQAEIWKY